MVSFPQFCTSVLSEGVDIKSCNKVIRFDTVRNVIDNIQARGRLRLDSARDNPDSYVIMRQRRQNILSDIRTEKEAVLTNKYIEQEAITYDLIRRGCFRDIPPQSSENNEFPNWPFSSVRP